MKQKKKWPAFLDHAAASGPCCICALIGREQKSPTELHHYGRSGMGMKCSDLMVARLCGDCHQKIQGRGYVAFDRADSLEYWYAMVEDNNAMLREYIEAQG